MSKVFKYVKLPLIVVLALVMQIIVANNFEIFGVTPNIVLVTIVIVSMWNDMTTSVIISCLIEEKILSPNRLCRFGDRHDCGDNMKLSKKIVVVITK